MLFQSSATFIYSNVLLRNMVNEIIGKISKGSKMDQIYIPKNRIGFNAGEYVLILPLKGKLDEGEGGKEGKKKAKLNFYGIKELEPLKMSLIESIIETINRKISPDNVDNIIFTGSFLEKGFRFNDIDLLLIGEEKINTQIIKEEIENMTRIKTHIIMLNNKTLAWGLSIDPLYSLMLSGCVSLKKVIFNVKREIDYKILDLNLLKSKTLIDNFSILNGEEKYYLTLNMVSILLFIQGKKLTKDRVNSEIEKQFNIKISELKGNLIEEGFIRKCKKIFNKTFNLILDSIGRINKEENGKQK